MADIDKEAKGETRQEKMIEIGKEIVSTAGSLSGILGFVARFI